MKLNFFFFALFICSLLDANSDIGKKEMISIKKGEKIYNIMCDKEKVNLLKKDSLTLKEQIQKNKICKNINKKQLEELILYLKYNKSEDTEKIDAPEKSKCPVCGMFVAKFKKWESKIETIDKISLYFDGVKDMMKFYFDPERFHHKKKKIKKILVLDFYTLVPIKAQEAFYVLGSNVYGPMGNEFIPFKSIKEAENFKNEHRGKSIVTFDKITEDLVYSLDQ